MTNAAAASRAASLLYSAMSTRKALAELPEECRPRSLAEAYAAQDRLVRLLGRPVGYKIAFTNPAIQKKLGVPEPASGRLIEGRIFVSPATLDARRLFRVGIETEFAFRMARDLPALSAPFAREDVAAAVDVLIPAIEIVDTRFGDWATCGALQGIADNAFGSHWVAGPDVRDWRGLDLAAHPVVTRVNGKEAGRGSGANALGHPLAALTWLANDLPSRGQALAAGDVITTGSCTDIVMVQRGDRVTADFGVLGSVEVQVT